MCCNTTEIGNTEQAQQARPDLAVTPVLLQHSLAQLFIKYPPKCALRKQPLLADKLQTYNDADDANGVVLNNALLPNPSLHMIYI